MNSFFGFEGFVASTIRKVRKNLSSFVLRVLVGAATGFFEAVFFFFSISLYGIKYDSFGTIFESSNFSWIANSFLLFILFDDLLMIVSACLAFGTTLFFVYNGNPVLGLSFFDYFLFILKRLIFLPVFLLLRKYKKTEKSGFLYSAIATLNFTSSLPGLFMMIYLYTKEFLLKFFPVIKQSFWFVGKRITEDVSLFSFSRVDLIENDVIKNAPIRIQIQFQDTLLFNSVKNGFGLFNIIIFILFFEDAGDPFFKLYKSKINFWFYFLFSITFVINFCRLLSDYPSLFFIVNQISLALLCVIICRGYLIIDFLIFRKLSLILRYLIYLFFSSVMDSSDSTMILCFFIAAIDFWFFNEGEERDIFDSE